MDQDILKLRGEGSGGLFCCNKFSQPTPPSSSSPLTTPHHITTTTTKAISPFPKIKPHPTLPHCSIGFTYYNYNTYLCQIGPEKISTTTTKKRSSSSSSPLPQLPTPPSLLHPTPHRLPSNKDVVSRRP